MHPRLLARAARSRARASSTGLASCTSSMKTCAKRIGPPSPSTMRPAEHLPEAEEQRVVLGVERAASRRRARPRSGRAPAARTTRGPDRAARAEARHALERLREALARRQQLVPAPSDAARLVPQLRRRASRARSRVTSGSAAAGATPGELALAGEPLRELRTAARPAGRVIVARRLPRRDHAVGLGPLAPSPRASRVDRARPRRASTSASIAAEHRRVRLGARHDRRRLVARSRVGSRGNMSATSAPRNRANVITGTPSTPSDGSTRPT